MKHTVGQIEHGRFFEFSHNKSQLYCEITPVGEFAILGYIFDPKTGLGAGEGQANAQRLCACWNACIGINPEAVKDLLKACQVTASELKDDPNAVGCYMRLTQATD